MKRMTKITALLVSVLLLCSAFAACGGTETAADVDINALADELLAGSAFSDILSEIPTETALMLYQLSADDVAECSVSCSTGATAEEIAVFKAASEAGATAIENAIKSRISYQTDSFKSYVPAEVPKLENAIVVRNGVYVAFVVAEDAETAKEIIGKYM